MRCADYKVYNRSFSYLGQDRKRYLCGLVLGAFELALLFAMPYINQELIDIVTGERQGDIMRTLLGMLVLFLLFVPPVVYGKYLQAIASAQGTARLRKELFRHILHMSGGEFARYKTGDYITRLTGNVDEAMSIFSPWLVIHLIRFVAVFPVTFMMLAAGDWRIAAAGIIYSGINLALSMRLNPLAKRLERRASAEIANSASFLIEALRSIPVIRVFALQAVLAERYRRACGVIREKRMKYQTVMGITYGTVDFFAQSAQAVGFILGIILASSEMALGKAVFHATLMGMMADSVFHLSTFLLLSQSRLVAMERVFNLLDGPLEDLEKGSAEIRKDGKIAVEFRNVSFAYEDSQSKVLEGLSFTLHVGEHLAIVGGSGGGKSTLIKLLEGVYAPTSGEIRYFDKPGTGLSLSAIRALFAYVPQESTLFDGSIRENIVLGKRDASQAEIEETAKMAGIHDFIQGLPQGYDAPAGEQGGQLSGGQRQRIAIARAILKGAPILLLDEATAALDSAAEREVQQCLDRLSVTTVTVAHRLSTIQNADRILVMEGGKVVEEGNFGELLAMGGRFFELYESQKWERGNEKDIGSAIWESSVIERVEKT